MMNLLRLTLVFSLISLFGTSAQANLCKLILDTTDITEQASAEDKAFLASWAGDLVFHDELPTFLKDFGVDFLSKEELQRLNTFTTSELKDSSEIPNTTKLISFTANSLRQAVAPYVSMRSSYYPTSWSSIRVKSWSDVHRVFVRLIEKEFLHRTQQELTEEARLKGKSIRSEKLLPHNILSRTYFTAPLLVSLTRLRIHFEQRQLLKPVYTDDINPFNWLSSATPVITHEVRRLVESGNFEAAEQYFLKRLSFPELLFLGAQQFSKVTVSLGLSGAILLGFELHSANEFSKNEVQTYNIELPADSVGDFKQFMNYYTSENPETTLVWLETTAQDPEQAALAEALREELGITALEKE